MYSSDRFTNLEFRFFLMNIYNIFDWQTENKLVFDQMFFFLLPTLRKLVKKIGETSDEFGNRLPSKGTFCPGKKKEMKIAEKPNYQLQKRQRHL